MVRGSSFDAISASGAETLAVSEAGTTCAGETVRYIITNADDKVKDWRSKPLALMENGLEYDVTKYLELLERAATEILDGLVPVVVRTKALCERVTRTLDLPLIFE